MLPTRKDLMLIAFALAACAFVLYWRADRSFGFDELIILILYACFFLWLLRPKRPRRFDTSRYGVEVLPPEKPSVQLIERRH